MKGFILRLSGNGPMICINNESHMHTEIHFVTVCWRYGVIDKGFILSQNGPAARKYCGTPSTDPPVFAGSGP